MSTYNKYGGQHSKNWSGKVLKLLWKNTHTVFFLHSVRIYRFHSPHTKDARSYSSLTFTFRKAKKTVDVGCETNIRLQAHYMVSVAFAYEKISLNSHLN